MKTTIENKIQKRFTTSALPLGYACINKEGYILKTFELGEFIPIKEFFTWKKGVLVQKINKNGIDWCIVECNNHSYTLSLIDICNNALQYLKELKK